MSQPRYSPLVARCTRRATSQCDILSQASPWLYSCRLCACSTRVGCAPLRGSGCSRLVTGIEKQMSMRHIVAGLCLCNTTVGCAPAARRARVTLKIQCCINVTRPLARAGARRCAASVLLASRPCSTSTSVLAGDP